MSLEVIEQRVASVITETSALVPETFKEDLYCRYQTQLLDDLKKCVSSDDFKRVLAANWQLVKGNTLCYTAQPEAPLTLLLVRWRNTWVIIKNADDFRQILQWLTPEQCTAVCEALKRNYLQLLKMALILDVHFTTLPLNDARRFVKRLKSSCRTLYKMVMILFKCLQSLNL